MLSAYISAFFIGYIAWADCEGTLTGREDMTGNKERERERDADAAVLPPPPWYKEGGGGYYPFIYYHY